MVTTGRLNEDGMALALEALARFRMLADLFIAEIREADLPRRRRRDAAERSGLCASRRSKVGRAHSYSSPARKKPVWLRKACSCCTSQRGWPGGRFPRGGSLAGEPCAPVQTGNALTFPFGPLRLVDTAKGDPDKARKLADKGLDYLQKFGALSGKSLYAVGGVWRSFARIDMESRNYPLHVLHDYAIPRNRALELCDLLARQSKKSLDLMRVVSRRRAEALPYGAVVLECWREATNLKDVVISAYGVRVACSTCACRKPNAARIRCSNSLPCHQCGASAARRNTPTSFSMDGAAVPQRA